MSKGRYTMVTPVSGCAGCDSTGGVASCPTHGGMYATKVGSYEKVLDLMAENAKLLSEAEHWKRARARTLGAGEILKAELDAALLQNAKLRTEVAGLKKALSHFHPGFHFAGCFGGEDHSGERCSEPCKDGRAAMGVAEKRPDEPKSLAQEPAKPTCGWCGWISDDTNDVIYRSAYGEKICDRCVRKVREE